MGLKGWSHVGLSTLDMDRTREFYENVLGFAAVRCDIIKVKEGGEIHHVFFDAGRGQLVAFMELKGIPGLPKYDPGINQGLGLPDPVYHFAFEAGSVAELQSKRAELIEKGVPVTAVVEHEWANSIYFKDPNGIMLEYCCYTRDLGDDDAHMQVRAEISLAEVSPITDFRDR